MEVRMRPCVCVEIWKGKRGLLWTLIFCSDLFVLLITDSLLIASFLLRTVCVCAKYCRKMSYTCIHTHSDKGRKWGVYRLGQGTCVLLQFPSLCRNSFIPDPVTLHVRRAMRDFVLTVIFIVLLIISNVLLRNNGQNI